MRFGPSVRSFGTFSIENSTWISTDCVYHIKIMAYAPLVSLAQTIHHILNHHQYSISPHEKQQIISLDKYIILLQAFLEDFPEEAKNFEGRIRDVAYEAEDVIECSILEQIAPCSAHHGYNLHGLKNLTHETESIACEVKDIRNNFVTKKARFLDSAAAASSSSRIAPTTKNDMVGFDDDLIEIKTRLCGESSKLQVIPIVGMGGIGKTTLARNAYDDPLIKEHFHIRVWVTISQEYSIQEIVSHLVLSIKSSNENHREQINKFERKTELTKEYVYKSLKGRRYLVVMDDMWSTKAWDDLRMIFPDDNYGSRIILTTRLSDVASYADSASPLHEMRFMDADQSWELLRRKVFAREDCPPELEGTGKAIAKSCRGLPLAIVVIAGLLSTINKTRASWKEIGLVVNSTVATKDGHFETILSLSYTHLPHHLRSCFLYMGGFSEDYEIKVSKLIKLWVAEGFLKPYGSKNIEDAAEEYLEDLVKRSLILVTKRKSNGKIKSCIVHDLVRDLCIRKANEEKFFLHVNGTYVGEDIKNQRRVSIAYSNLNCLANIYASTIRTVICVHRTRGSSLDLLTNFRLLRVLDMLNANASSFPQLFVSLPAQIFELIHLRYLALYNHAKIPTTISNLQNLQTLILHPGKTSREYIPCLVRLPMEIWKMPQLRHLVSSYFDILPEIPHGVTFELENLQTLSVATEFKCTEKILKMIPNLKKLGIYYFGNRDGAEYRLDNLVHLQWLETLDIEIFRSFRKIHDPVFPRTLKKLTLSGRILSWKDMTVVGSLPNLQVLKLKHSACYGGKWETTEGEFLELRFLLICRSDLQHWITESSHFPRLKCLRLHHCRDLSKIPEGIGEVSTLELIEVDDLNKSLAESAKQIQEEQQSWGNNTLQVQFIRTHQVLWCSSKSYHSFL